jgi:tetraprenyl-beta-curcumene synthase
VRIAAFTECLRAARIVARHVCTDHRVAVRELSRWKERATRIPDTNLRAHALEALTETDEQALGSALFSILSHERSESLVRLLVAYQVLWNYVDATSEASKDESQSNGRALHRALAEAVDTAAPLTDHYALHPWKEDGGYLLELITACRECCLRLPTYAALQPVIVEAASLAEIQGANHLQDSLRREMLLKSLSAGAFTGDHALAWYERAVAMSSTMPQAFLVLAAGQACSESEIAATRAMYFGLMAVVFGMLDSYADQERDSTLDRHSYFGYYPSLQSGVKRTEELIKSLAAEARRLPRSERHSILVSCAVAVNLTSPGAKSISRRPLTYAMIRNSDALTRLIVYAFRIWRPLHPRFTSVKLPLGSLSAKPSCAVTDQVGTEKVT